MDSFKLRSDAIAEIRNKTLSRTIPLMMVAGAVGIYISITNVRHEESSVNVLPIVIPVVAVILSISIYKGVNRQKKALDSYTLNIGNGIIVRKQGELPDISLSFDQVHEITKAKNGAYCIIGMQKNDIIYVPAQMENLSLLEAALNQIRPINEKATTTVWQKSQQWVGFISLGLMLCVFVCQHKIVVLISGLAFLSLMTWSFFAIQKSKNVDKLTKRKSWWVVLVFCAVLVRMIIKVTGWSAG